MKRRFSLILAVVLAVALVAVIPLATTASDTETTIGNVETGYTPDANATAITNAAEFAAMTANGNYYLANDIEITATYAADFTGKLDGNGKIITTSAPLFKNLKGEVKNLKITGEVSVSNYDAGALAQRADAATVTNVLNSAKVTGSKTVITETYNYTNVSDAEGVTKDEVRLAGTAGLVGSATGVCTFTDCMNLGAINGSPAGGIVGVMGYEPNASSFTFINCYNEGAISDEGCSNEGEPNPQGEDRGVGGIAGYALDAKTVYFENCHNKGSVDASFADDDGTKAAKTVTGGIFGYVALSANTTSNGAVLTVKNCTNEGAIKGSGQTGGILGYNGKCDFTVDGCTNKESASVASTTSYIGGVVGRSDGVAYVKNCQNYASALSAASGTSGGIVGYMDGTLTIENCINYASVDFTASNRSFAGIIGGGVYDTNTPESGCTTYIKNCKNLGNITVGAVKAGGIAVDLPHAYIENCVNEGKITANSIQTAGIIGRTYYASEIKGCVNNGDVTSPYVTTSSKGAIGGIVGYGNTDLNIYDCVNTGNISSGSNAAAGIAGNLNKGGTISNCLNTGNVTATDRVAGIVGSFAAANTGKEIMLRCGNTGNITATTGDAGGIAGYVFGGSVAGTNDTILMYCFNTGNIVGVNRACGGIGYVNSGSAVPIEIKYNYFGGTLTATTTASAVMNNNAAPLLDLAHNYSVEGYSSYEAAVPQGTSVALTANTTADAIASGELTYTLNAAIKAADSTITADVFYQNLGADGDAHPVLDNTHKAVIKNADGTYSNDAAPEVTTPEVTTPEVTTPEVTTTIPDVTTTVPDATTTEPSDVTTTEPSDNDTTTTPADVTTTEKPDDNTTKTPDEPKKKSCGSFALAAQIITLLGAALTVVIVKKKA